MRPDPNDPGWEQNECPVPCARCAKVIDLHDAYHHPRCERCRDGRQGCDNLICQECASKVLNCMEDNCNEPGSVYCYLPDTDLSGPPDYYYCAEHCHQNGFCYGCGSFYAGIESFDFRKSGLCDNCESQGDYEDDDEDDYPVERFYEVEDCPRCDGTGGMNDSRNCPNCAGTGRVNL